MPYSYSCSADRLLSGRKALDKFRPALFLHQALGREAPAAVQTKSSMREPKLPASE